MENIINTDNIVYGDSDISGVKNNSAETAPEQLNDKSRHAADDGKNGYFSVNKSSAKTDAEGKTMPKDLELACGEGRNTDSSAEQNSCVISACGISDAEREDREFLSLVKGKYKEAYKRQVEGIIRKRLKSTKGKQSARKENALAEKTADECTDAVSFDAPGLNTVTVTHADVLSEPEKDSMLSLLEKKRKQMSAQRNQNQLRPRENGVGGSVGMYTGIKVSALKGSDVLALLRRAESGEKIKFN